MKYFSLILLIFLNGCLYVNERGVSTYLYDKCHEYYDADGKYHNDCNEVLSTTLGHEAKNLTSTLINSTKSLIEPNKSELKSTKTSTSGVKKRKCKLVCTKKTKCKCKKKRKCANKDK